MVQAQLDDVTDLTSAIGDLYWAQVYGGVAEERVDAARNKLHEVLMRLAEQMVLSHCQSDESRRFHKIWGNAETALLGPQPVPYGKKDAARVREIAIRARDARLTMDDFDYLRALANSMVNRVLLLLREHVLPD